MSWLPAGVPMIVALYFVVGLYAVVGAFLGLATTLPRADVGWFKNGGLIGFVVGCALCLLEWAGMSSMLWGPAVLWVPLGVGLLLASGLVGRALALVAGGRPRAGFWLGLVLGPLGWVLARFGGRR